jgi:ParB family chromosome partitioning protein
MKVLIKDIKIKKRVRKDLGDLHMLKESLNRYGLMNPITINSQYELVAGHRRLEAAKSLGWSTIDAIMVETKDKLLLLELELEENNQRKPFTDDELYEGYKALEKLRNPSFFAKLLGKIKSLFEKAFDKKEARKIEKVKKNGLMSILLPVGLLLIILGAILYKKEFITAVLHTFMDLTGFVAMVVGLFYFIRFYIGIKKN